MSGSEERAPGGGGPGWPAKTVRRLLDIKGHAVWSVSPDTSVYGALQLMSLKDVGALLVLDQGRVAGIFSERDYARKVALRGKSSRDIPVRDIMTTDVLCVDPDKTVDQCLALMTDKRVRHLPVVSGGELVGLISIGDIVREVISDQGFIISQLETYIRGK